MKVALVHDYLVQDGGAERVLVALHELFPQAPIFTLFNHLPEPIKALSDATIVPSSLHRLPGARRHYQWYLPFMPQAIEDFDLSGFDLVLSNASSFAKGAIADPHAVHLSYCHTPTRFLWQQRQGYVADLPHSGVVKRLLPPLLHRLRQWDQLAAQRPDQILTNSQTSQARIARFYRRSSTIIHPPVDVERIPVSTTPGDFWLAGGRLVAYKRFDLIVQAFQRLNLPLKIFGTGPEEQRLRTLAGPRTEFLGRVDDTTKHELYAKSIAYIHPQVEDFGITAIEAMAAGKPVIAFDAGGARETVKHGVTGILFPVQCWEEIGNTVLRFDQTRFDPKIIRTHAETFSKTRFLAHMKQTVQNALSSTRDLC